MSGSANDPPKGLKIDAADLIKLSQLQDGTWVEVPGDHAPLEIGFIMQLERQAPALKKSERGLVLSGAVGRDAEGKPISLAPPSASELRQFCLFWDRLDYPCHDFNEVVSDPDLSFLIASGVLERTTFAYQFPPSLAGSPIDQGDIIQGPAEVFAVAEGREPGQWSLARGLDGATFATDDLAWGRGLLFELHNAIPVPAADVPLADVLDFKAKRSDELQALRQELGAIYQLVLDAPDAAHAYRHHLDRLDKALADAVKVSRESKFPIQLSNLQAKLDHKIWPAGSAAFAAASVAGLGLTNAALAAMGAAALSSLNMTAGLRSSKSKGTPFEYVTRFHGEIYR